MILLLPLASEWCAFLQFVNMTTLFLCIYIWSFSASSLYSICVQTINLSYYFFQVMYALNIFVVHIHIIHKCFCIKYILNKIYSVLSILVLNSLTIIWMVYFAEFRKAIQRLGAQHPAAYQEFIQHLLPANPALSRIHVNRDSNDIDSVIIPEAGLSFELGMARAQVLPQTWQNIDRLSHIPTEPGSKLWPAADAKLEEDMWIGEESEVSSVDEFPVAGVSTMCIVLICAQCHGEKLWP